jgi:hypothetical protein
MNQSKGKSVRLVSHIKPERYNLTLKPDLEAFTFSGKEVIDIVFEKPVCIIAHTTPGKGVEFMEWKPEWHGKPPNEAQAEVALQGLQTLRTLQGKLVKE